MPLLVCFLLAGSVAETHRARAERAEALGRIRQAAREYEAAWEEEQEPDLLYRLGIARRKLKEYAKARAALRAYLRAAPHGGLRHEVERQLAKVDVLIEAAAEDPSEAARATIDLNGAGCATAAPHETFERVTPADMSQRRSSLAAWLATAVVAAGLLGWRLARRAPRAAT